MKLVLVSCNSVSETKFLRVIQALERRQRFVLFGSPGERAMDSSGRFISTILPFHILLYTNSLLRPLAHVERQNKEKYHN